MKAMIAKYPGTCTACGDPIKQGEPINHFHRGRTEHQSCTQVAAEDAEEHGGEDESAGFEPGTLANDRRMAKRGLSIIRFASGAVMTRNSRGRCEDAPACGCCTY